MMEWNAKSAIEALLDETDAARLRAIWEPTVVGVMPQNARRYLCVMPDGELRSYGVTGKSSYADPGRPCYLSSRSGGLDWRLRYAPEGCMGAAAYDGERDRFPAVAAEDGRGTFCLLSDKGPDDTEFRRVLITEHCLIDYFQPVRLPGGRWYTTASCFIGPGEYHPVFMYSDDGGENWETVIFPPTRRHSPVWPDLDQRWQNSGSEPYAARLPDGRLMMVARTSLDHLYVYYSFDDGTSWTEGEESDFPCTLTTPFLLSLEDGRTAFFWNNARPLSEARHDFADPPLSDGYLKGYWEDVFTNRDVCHCALTENGTDWIGVRELYLNPIRDAADFRTKGGPLSSSDKSVHQFQAIELPFGKILVEFGQHEVSRRIVIFDVGWLYEKKRTEDFRSGLEHISSHLYLRSVSGSHLKDAPGHCAWNRIPGAVMMPSPDRDCTEVLLIGRVHDERLVSEKQGAVWAFPAAKKGRLTVRLMVRGAGLRFCLCGTWINPCEEYAAEFAPFHFDLDGRCLTKNEWHDIEVRFDCAARRAAVYDGGKLLFAVRMTAQAPLGLTYLHMQTLAEAEDFEGTCVKRIDFASGG